VHFRPKECSVGYWKGMDIKELDVCVTVHHIQSDTNLHTVHKTTHQLLRTTATTPSAEHHVQQYTTRTPEDGHIDVRNM